MRIVFFALLMSLAPDALAQRCCNCGGASDAAAIIQGIGASAQLSVISTQLSIAAHQLSQACRADSDCTGTYRCSNNECVQRAAAAPVSQRQQTVELLLRQRAVELREELALGRGPVIRDLAAAQGVAPATFGPLLKQHRVALVAIIGDGKDPAWAARFRAQLDALSGA